MIWRALKGPPISCSNNSQLSYFQIGIFWINLYVCILFPSWLLCNVRFTMQKQPSYLPDVAPSEWYCLFLKIKRTLSEDEAVISMTRRCPTFCFLLPFGHCSTKRIKVLSGNVKKYNCLDFQSFCFYVRDNKWRTTPSYVSRTFLTVVIID
jgi:hypothetical protein